MLGSSRLRLPGRHSHRYHSSQSAVQNDRLSPVTGDALDFAGAVAFAQKFYDTLLLLDG